MLRRIWCAMIAPLAMLVANQPVQAHGGTLVIVGGALEPDNEAIFGAFLEARPAGSQRIAIIAAASNQPSTTAQAFRDALARHGVDPAAVDLVALAVVDDPATGDVDESLWSGNASDPAEIGKVANAGAIWFSGGDQARISTVLLRADGSDTPMLRAIRERLAAGAVVGGTSAGAAIMSGPMIVEGDSLTALIPEAGGEALAIGRGLGFLPGTIVDQHFGQRARLGRLAVALSDSGHRHLVGLGVDEDTALIVRIGDATAHVAGAGYVTTLDASRAVRGTTGLAAMAGLTIGLAAPGDTIDLASGAVSPAAFKAATIGNEYRNAPPIAGGGMAMGGQTLADVAGEALLDNAAARAVERYSFVGGRGVTYRFEQTDASAGWWGRGPQGARYALTGVAFAIEPITVAIRKVVD